MGHGTHGRNNNCFNCHNETKLDTLQSRDGRELRSPTVLHSAAVAMAPPSAIGKPACTAARADIGTRA